MSFKPQQINDLTAKLSADNVSKREQAGRKLSYVEGWHVIAEANRIFGFDAWDRETVDCRLVSEKPRSIGKPPNQKDGFGVGYIAKVRVTVRADGVTVTREGTGYGSGIDADLGSAHESAIKEAETDAMKRALMTFGNPFGLALYDKDQENVEPAKPAASTTRPAKPAAAPAPKADKPLKYELLNATSAIAGVFATPDEWCRALRKNLTTEGAQVSAIWKANEMTLQAISDANPAMRWPIGGKMVHPADDLKRVFEQLAPGIAA